MAADLAIKEPVRAATTENITLSGLQTIDGVTLSSGDRVLVRAQSTATQNGLYVAASGSWTRTTDFDGAGEVTGGTQVYVQEGDSLGDIAWRVAGDIPVTPGSNAITFEPEFLQDGADAVPRPLELKARDVISVRDFGAKGDGTTDDTAAFQAAIDVASSFGNTMLSIYIPPGTYRITDTVEINRDFVTLYGAGDKSSLLFDPAEGGNTMLLVQNGADPEQIIKYITLRDFSFRAAYPAETISKVGIALVDATRVSIRNVNVTDYSWTNSARGSIALHMAGRDTHNIIDCLLIADAPIYVSPNPNSNIWQFDYHNFIGLLLQTLDPSGYGITFAAGVNPSSWSVIGCATVSGNGGIYLNNQGTPMDGTPSMIRISNFRCEGGTANGVGLGGGYGIYMDFGSGNPACGNLELEECSVNDPSCYGFYLKGISGLTVRNVNCGFGAVNNAFILTDVGTASITNLGIGDDAATVLLTDMYAQRLHKLPGASPTSKSIFFGLYLHYAADSPTNNLVYENGVRKWQRTQVLANGNSMTLPALAAGKSMIVTVCSAYGGAQYVAVPTVTARIAGTTGFGITSGDVISCETDGAGNTTIENNSAGTMEFFVETMGG